MPQQASISFYGITLEVSEVSEFSILALILKLKTWKTWKFFKTSKFEWIFFNWRNWEFPRFPSFRFWHLCWDRKLWKLGNFFKAYNCFVGGSWKFRRFPSFQFWPLYWNWKLGKLRNFSRLLNLNEFFLIEEIGNFRGFLVLDFGTYAEIKNSLSRKQFDVVPLNAVLIIE